MCGGGGGGGGDHDIHVSVSEPTSPLSADVTYPPLHWRYRSIPGHDVFQRPDTQREFLVNGYIGFVYFAKLKMVRSDSNT